MTNRKPATASLIAARLTRRRPPLAAMPQSPVADENPAAKVCDPPRPESGDSSAVAEANRQAAALTTNDTGLVRQVSQLTFVDLLLAAQNNSALSRPILRLRQG